MPKTENQFKEMRENSRKHIINVSLGLFAKNGFRATSISMIAKEAGIATGLIYNYFKSKEELLERILHESLYENSEALKDYFTDFKSIDDCIILVENMFRIIMEKIVMWRLIMRVLLEPELGDTAKKSVHMHLYELEKNFRNYLEKKQDPVAAKKAHLIVSLIHGTILGYIMSEDREMLDLVKEEIKSIISKV